MLYLRARFYTPNTGRFLTKDTWDGDSYQPMSYNWWLYAYGSPNNYVDPTGLNPNCKGSAEFCARERLDEIFTVSGGNGARALVNVFADSELYNRWGGYAGTTSATRLQWLLTITRGDASSFALDTGTKVLVGIHLQFGILFPTSCSIDPQNPSCGCGLLPELEDSGYYGTDRPWRTQVSYQINHFLSGVGEYYYGKDLRIIIAHEKSSDENKWKNYWNQVTDEDKTHFQKAWDFDANGMYSDRDDELWAILDFDEIERGNVDPDRRGNSLEDLRLSLKAVRFADWVMSNPASNPSQAGDWLTVNLLPQ